MRYSLNDIGGKMKSVQITALELKNYRQFIDQTIDFSVPKEKNLIVVEGKNGFGKSNIFNAITYVFYLPY